MEMERIRSQLEITETTMQSETETLWGSLARFVDDGQLPVDNTWLLVGSHRAAAVMSLIGSFRMNARNPCVAAIPLEAFSQ